MPSPWIGRVAPRGGAWPQALSQACHLQERYRTLPDLLDRLAESLERSPLVRFYQRAFRDYPELLMKDLTLEAVGPDRDVKLDGRWVVNFGSDSFLGLDQDPRVQEALRRGLDRWGTHNGASRAFSSVASNVEAEQKL